MKNELIPLEALEKLYRELAEGDTTNVEGFDYSKANKYLHIVETALKDYEQIKDMCESYGIEFSLANIREALFTLAQLKGEKENNWENYNKKLKALEIIKNKKVNVRCLMSGWHLGNYNSYKAHIRLTEEEYDLLKEVLM